MITTIIFDLSDVYLHGVAGSGKHLQKRLGTKITDLNILLFELDQLFLGEISEDIYWQAVIKRNNWKNASIEELKDAVRKNFKEIKGTRKIIEKLKQNGYKLGLLSNHAKEWVEYCELTYNYHKLFHTIVYSYEVGFSKPNSDIFLAILRLLKVKPEECLFIDDYIKNIETAKEIGFNTIHFKSAPDLKKKLKELKIRI